jgi:hypothetical protein
MEISRGVRIARMARKGASGMAMVPGRVGNRWTDMGAGSDDEGEDDGKGRGVGIEGWCM